MKRLFAGLAAAGLLAGSSAAWALTSLAKVTPQNIEKGTFRLKAREARNDSVEFVIQRDVRNISLPGRRAFLTNSETERKSLGTPVKLEEDGKLWTFRFTVPEEKVADTVFTLWGNGQVGEGVTYQFRLGEFWKPQKP